MKKNNLDKYKTAWKNEKGFDKLDLSDSQIIEFLGSRTKNISRLFRVGLTIDIAIKSLLLFSFAGLIVLLSKQSLAVLVNCLLIAVTLIGIIYQIITYRKIPVQNNSFTNIRDSLSNKIEFYNSRYMKSLLINALSGSLFFLSGMLYYFYFRYGEIRKLDINDLIVFGAIILISFAMGAFAQIKQHNFQINQLESCMKDIDEDTLDELRVKQYKNQRIRNIVVMSVAIVLGLLLLIYMIVG